jgi:acyl-CoA synthetase (AMP-forming)/AMP-acid ligase II
MIISGGFNIYPGEVEAVITKHPHVTEAAVFGVPHNLWGETVKAAVVKAAGASLTGKQIIEFCRERLASYKKPVSVDFVKEIPRNANGKVDRRLLRAPFWEGFNRHVH